MKDDAVAVVMDAFVEPADDAVADWSDVVRRAEAAPAATEADPARNGSVGLPPANRPRIWWRRRPLQIALVVIVLGAAGATAVVWRGNTEQATTATTAREVVRRTQSALVDASDLIVHSRQVSSNGTVQDSWEDGHDDRRRMEIRAGGQLALVTVIENRPGEFRFTNVDYRTRTWSTVTTSVPSGVGPLGMSGHLPEQLHENLSNGKLTLVGIEELNGRETLHLTRTFPPPVGSPVQFGSLRIDYWIDRDTYLPLRLQGANVIRGMTMKFVTDYEWLPRTEENVSKTRLTVPPGFRRVSGGTTTTTVITPGSP